ncbi:MAG: class I SAM-dependent methyltransferase [Caldilineaceae bacterium]|nr:class I SAM-dependent methyltransferase [Caldilineaceae bacterium]
MTESTAQENRIGTDATVWKKAALVERYLGRVRKGVPMAEAQIDVMMRVIEGRGQPVENFLDLGCGDGILAATILTEYPEASGVLVDFSTPMIQAALRNLKEYSHALHLTTLDYSEPSWFDMVAARGPFDVIVSGYSIHHQPDAKKQQIYADVFDLLKPGGVFVNMEHVASSTPWVEARHDDFFIDSLWASQVGSEDAKSREEIAAAYHVREDKAANQLTSVERQCAWLRQIGFQDVDCYFKAFELAVFGGRRPFELPEREDA